MLCSARLMWVWLPGGRDWLGSFAFRLANNMQKAQVDQLSFMCLVPTCRETVCMYRYYTMCMCIHLQYIQASSRNLQQSAQNPPSPLSAAALQSARRRLRFALAPRLPFPGLMCGTVEAMLASRRPLPAKVDGILLITTCRTPARSVVRAPWFFEVPGPTTLSAFCRASSHPLPAKVDWILPKTNCQTPARIRSGHR